MSSGRARGDPKQWSKGRRRPRRTERVRGPGRGCASRARPPPLSRDRCFRTVLISPMEAPARKQSGGDELLVAQADAADRCRKEGRSAAGDEREDDVVLPEAAHGRFDRPGCSKTSGIGQRVGSEEKRRANQPPCGRRLSDGDAEGDPVTQDRFGGGGHDGARLSSRHEDQAPSPAAQHLPLARQSGPHQVPRVGGALGRCEYASGVSAKNREFAPRSGGRQFPRTL